MNRYTNSQLFVLEKPIVKCNDVRSLLLDYTDRELPITLRARVDSHLRECECCRDEFSSYQMVIDIARELKATRPLPQEVKNRLHAALNAKLGLSLPVES